LRDLVLITGASSGIGLSAAIESAAAGFDVVATVRRVEKAKELEAAARAHGVFERVHVEELDVMAESQSAGEKVKELIQRYGTFYGLVNNAGIAVAGPFEEHSERDIREQFETNVFGLMAITRAVLPSMRAARRGRIINMSSVSGRMGAPLVSVYAASKHAVEGFSEALRWELDEFGVDVCLVEPGMFKTLIFHGNQRIAERLDRAGPYGRLTQVVEARIRKDADRAPPPDEVGKTVARLLRAPSPPPFRTPVGKDAVAFIALRRLIPDRLFAMGVRRAMGRPRSR
jgi:NAD(P)-dependent dehydrogenase (short-subunit alcohol dehydrogenase family)